MSGNPEELLRSTLEKIVFFECRVGQLQAELETARSLAARAQGEASRSRQREVELSRQAAEARAQHAEASSKNAELLERVRLLEGERARFLSGLIEQARVQGAPGVAGNDGEGGAELAGFIAELRAENVRLERWKVAAQAAGIALEDGSAAPLESLRAAPAPLAQLAARFEQEGRTAVTAVDARALETTLSTRADRALYEASMDDLASADAGARRRAAECLEALSSKAAAPLVAAALGREQDDGVKVALLGSLAALADAGAVDLAARELSDHRPAVRAAALEAVNALAKDRAEPYLAGALGDPSPLVRRRAALLLGFVPGEGAEDALVSALIDKDAGVARAAVSALSGRPTARAQGALARAVDHRDPTVRAAAGRAVARWAGEVADAAASEADRRRAARRITEKLAGMSGEALRGAVMRSARGSAATAVPRAAAPLSLPAAGGEGQGGVAPSPREAAAPAPRRAVAPAASPATRALQTAVLGEVRASLRGETVAGLASSLSTDPLDVEAALRALVAQGALVARGPRFFMS
ncbi:MAG TPA: HEAT repeat domain-containing protein [Anaeromyxobacteraceae bacterium]|nr:HEAT repeat domain-containing protein [Anaeromyxobacteraceae bacterium]